MSQKTVLFGFSCPHSYSRIYNIVRTLSVNFCSTDANITGLLFYRSFPKSFLKIVSHFTDNKAGFTERVLSAVLYPARGTKPTGGGIHQGIDGNTVNWHYH